MHEKAIPRKEEPIVSVKEKEIECPLQLAVLNLEEDSNNYSNVGFGKYPTDGDNNVHCLMCKNQLDCIKLST